MEHPLWIILIAGLCFLAAGMAKGITGMGLPTVIMCTMIFVMPGAKAAALLVVPSLVTNLWQLFVGPGMANVFRRLAIMQVGTFVGTFAGIGHLTGHSPALANGVLGVVLTVYAIFAMRSVTVRLSPRREIYLSPIIGLATGLLGGATGLFVVPSVPYISALGFEREQLIKALGFSFGTSTVALAAALASRGAFGMQQAGLSALALLPAMLGMFVGECIRRRLRAEVFKRWFLVAVLLVGISMVVRAFA